MPEPLETQTANEALPLFRPEAVAKQERFFGEVLRIRPFSFMFLAWLVFAAAVTACALFFGTYTETLPVRGVSSRAPMLETHRRLFELLKPSPVRGTSQP